MRTCAAPDTSRSAASPGPQAIPTWVGQAVLLALLALLLAGAFLPARRLWGLNHLAFYPLPLRAGLLCLIGISFLPPVARRVHSVLASGLRWVQGHRRIRRWLIPAVSIACLVLFAGFRSSHLLWGDGRLVANNFQSAFAGQETVVAGSAAAILVHEPIAKGATLLYHGAARLAVGPLGRSALDGIRAINCLLGALAVWLLLRVILGGRHSTDARLWSIWLIFTSGAIQLFFGYVENYTPLVFVSCLYLLSGLALLGSSSVIWMLLASICLGLSIFTHFQAIVLVPSLGFAAGVLAARRAGRPVPKYLGLILLVLSGAAVYLVVALTPYGRYFLRVAGTGDTYSLFSAAHLSDMANEVVLILPTAPVLAVLAIYGLWLHLKEHPGRQPAAPLAPRASRPGSSPPGTSLRQSDSPSPEAWQFVLIGLAASLGFLAFAKPDLGMPRDWDLFTLVAVPLLATAVFVIRWLLAAGRLKQVALVAVPGMTMSVVLAVLWVGINASPERAIDRFESILKYDSSNAPYAFEVLAAQYHDLGDLDRATAIMAGAVATADNPRLTVILGEYYEEAGRLDDATDLLRRDLHMHPKTERARRNLCRLLFKQGAFEELSEVAREGTIYFPNMSVYHYFYGKALILTGHIDQGIAELVVCKNLGLPPDVAQEIDYIISHRPRSRGPTQ
jgi:hypothetical protein